MPEPGNQERRRFLPGYIDPTQGLVIVVSDKPGEHFGEHSKKVIPLGTSGARAELVGERLTRVVLPPGNPITDVALTDLEAVSVVLDRHLINRVQTYAGSEEMDPLELLGKFVREGLARLSREEDSHLRGDQY